MENEARLLVVEKQLEDIKSAMLRMETKLDAWQENYVPRAEINEMFRSRDESIRDIRDENTRLWDERRANKQTIPSWIQVAISLGAIGISLWALKK